MKTWRKAKQIEKKAEPEERRRSLRLHADPVVEIRDEQKEYEQR
jgi:hypothetical protein